MKTFAQFNETLDRPVDSSVTYNGDSETHRFRVGGIRYTLDFMSSDVGYELEYGWDMYGADGLPSNTYDPNAKQPQPVRVLSTVIDIVRKKLDEEPNKGIEFYADRKLVKVYDAIAKKFSADSKYQVSMHGSGSGKNYVIRKVGR